MNFDSTTIPIIIAVLAVLVLAFLIMRPRKSARVERKPAEPYVASKERPYMKGRGDATSGFPCASMVQAASWAVTARPSDHRTCVGRREGREGETPRADS